MKARIKKDKPYHKTSFLRNNVLKKLGTLGGVWR